MDQAGPTEPGLVRIAQAVVSQRDFTKAFGVEKVSEAVAMLNPPNPVLPAAHPNDAGESIEMQHHASGSDFDHDNFL